MEHDEEIEEALFEAATGIRSPAARRMFLDILRRGDPEQSARLDDLLTALDDSRRFFRESEEARTAVAVAAGTELIDTVPDDGGAGTPGEEVPGNRIGRYRLRERVGEGGCGIVYHADQLEPVRREVALKIIRLGMDTERVIARFGLERQALAMMDHAHIARVLDAGATDTGRPYFVMEWVRGSRITDYCDEHRLDIRRRIDLFIEVCKAIQHAHQKGVVHRDIKPSNILVSETDGKPVPKVIDFGIAKAIAGDPFEDGTLTQDGQFVGTPAYMSPEQMDSRQQDVDTRSDVYSLGVLLYELLVGTTPFAPRELAAAGFTGMRRILMEREPPLPSAAFSAMDAARRHETATCRGTLPGRFRDLIRGDLDAVVMKAIEKDRAHRYETAYGLVTDLLRYLGHEPVFARPRNRIYLVRKFVRRNRVVVGATAAIVLSLLLGMGAAVTYYLRERAAREEQERLRLLAEIAHDSELRQFAEARGWEDFAQVSLLLSEGRTEEADAQLRTTPLSSIQLSPRSAAVLSSLGNWNSLRGRWHQAADCFRMLMRADREGLDENLTRSLDLLAFACAFHEGGKPDDYGLFREWAVNRYQNTDSSLDAARVLHATLLAPADPAFLSRLAPFAAKLENTEFDRSKLQPGWDQEAAIWRAFSLALLEYRRGDHARARRWAEVGLGFNATRDYINTAVEPVHAMACFRLGEEQTARSTLDRTRIRIGRGFAPELPAAYEPFGRYHGYWWDWIIGRILFREAEALAGGSGAPAR